MMLRVRRKRVRNFEQPKLNQNGIQHIDVDVDLVPELVSEST